MTDSIRNYTDSLLRDLEENEGGFFKIENLDGLAYLTVFPSGKKGKSVEIREVFKRLEVFKISESSEEEVKRVVKNRDGEPHFIGKWPGKPEASHIELKISEDKMTAHAILQPPKYGGKVLSEVEILFELKKEGIEFGIKSEEIARLAKAEEYGKRVLIAIGEPPIPGSDGDLRILFQHPSIPKLEEDEFGRVDFKNIQIIQSVKKNQKLAEKISPSPGKPGKNVNGDLLPFEEGKPAEWKLGSNVKISEDKNQIFALIDGRPIVDRYGVIRVDEVCHLDHVDFSTGNINFPGTIIVEESIADGFVLETEGSIVVKKSVGKVFLKAGGDIVLSGGFMGRNGGLIESGADIYAKFVEQGKMIAKNSIFIEEASMHSELIAGESILVRGGRGELIGGQCVAGKNITCSKLGAIVETKTVLSCGMPPELLTELEDLKAEVRKNHDVLKKVEASIVKLNDDSQRRTLSNEEKESLPKLQAIKQKYQSILENLLAQEQSVILSFDPDKNAYIEVEREIFPGVDANLGRNRSFKVKLKEIPGPSFLFLGTDGQVVHSKVRPKRLGILQEDSPNLESGP
ncbi:PF03961 family protein [Leptospira broomii serovar Hurstbridge str. 5399]|uniref:PF03961 family protein n=1 Tax=Leptospira broomii serovar Hurstbridge str. 5399 TaxID=1049789 RepID=T0GNT8_9LEPT|nr:FapA family protein [Leptospira broomii]EQA46988.1 PF03961 family protein [Leptospira broomii serovar Hurstbridge str. 5399]